MNIQVLRIHLLDECTVGKIYIDGKDFEMFTLEDKVRDVKIPNETAIPYGRYPLVLDYSHRFSRLLPHILNVPNFEGVRIHPGNRSSDTDGCVLLGLTWDGGDFIGKSREAFNSFFERLIGQNDITIEFI